MDRRIHDAFAAVTADVQRKESTKRFLREARRPKRRRAPWMVPVLASLIVCLCCWGGFAYLNTPVSYISMDVNPSIELTLNRLHRVIAAQAWNIDGERVVQQVRVNGLTYTEAIDTLLESEAMQPFLTAQAELTFTVSAADQRTETLLLEGIGACAGCQKHRGQRGRANRELVEEAHRQGLSFGKYKAYQALQEQGYAITPEECREMSMAELHRLLREQDPGHRRQQRHGRQE